MMMGVVQTQLTLISADSPSSAREWDVTIHSAWLCRSDLFLSNSSKSHHTRHSHRSKVFTRTPAQDPSLTFNPQQEGIIPIMAEAASIVAAKRPAIVQSLTLPEAFMCGGLAGCAAVTVCK
jgi:hypothetical protein